MAVRVQVPPSAPIFEEAPISGAFFYSCCQIGRRRYRVSIKSQWFLRVREVFIRVDAMSLGSYTPAPLMVVHAQS